MSSVKEKILERVREIQDPQLLKELLQAVELESEIDQIGQLTDDEIAAIDEGIKDADAGKMYSNTQATELVQQWLRK